MNKKGNRSFLRYLYIHNEKVEKKLFTCLIEVKYNAANGTKLENKSK